VNRTFQFDLKQLLVAAAAVGALSVGAHEAVVRPAATGLPDLLRLSEQLVGLRHDIDALRYELCDFKNDMRSKDGLPPRSCSR